MKILYFGTICNKEHYEKIVKNSKAKPSVAPQTFETMFVNGLIKDKTIDIDINSFPMIKTFLSSGIFGWGAHRESVCETQTTTWLPAVNLPVLKQICFKFFSKIRIKKWIKRNKDDDSKCILIYSAFDPIVKNIIKLSDKYGIRAVAIIPDLPKHMYSNTKTSKIKSFLSRYAIKDALEYQSQFDGYILFTKNMADELEIKTPHVVLEGLAVPEYFDNLPPVKKEEDKKVLMYAGALSEKYGLDLLIKAFMSIPNENYELRIFGAGDFEKKIIEYAKTDKRIAYYGRVSRDEVLVHEKKADLLINVRNPDDEFTRFSFPSKNMEYLSSGTPFLTTILPGMPEEYLDYVYKIDEFSQDAICQAIEQTLSLSKEELIEKGRLAKEFMRKYKSCDVRMQEILSFLKQIVAKPKIFQINCSSYGSTGSICKAIHNSLLEEGIKSYFAFGYGKYHFKNAFSISNWFDRRVHDKISAIMGFQGFFSIICTLRLLKKIKKINPDIFHLHNLHGNYVNIPLLLRFLKDKKTVLTLHDCWMFTGKCTHYTNAGCYKWHTMCGNCAQLKKYPRSLLFDTSKINYKIKKKLLCDMHALHIVTVSDWLKSEASKSFLKDREITRVYNGIDTSVFRPTSADFKTKHNIEDKFMVLGVSGIWNESKGLSDIIKLREMLDDRFAIVLVGTSQEIDGIMTIRHTNNAKELAQIYSAADVFFSPSTEETFGLVTAEAIACQTPVIVYNSTACAEIVTQEVGYVLKPNDVPAVAQTINALYNKEKKCNPDNDFSVENMTANYKKIYNSLE